jgi:hypothetical protein
MAFPTLVFNGMFVSLNMTSFHDLNYNQFIVFVSVHVLSFSASTSEHLRNLPVKLVHQQPHVSMWHGHTDTNRDACITPFQLWSSASACPSNAAEKRWTLDHGNKHILRRRPGVTRLSQNKKAEWEAETRKMARAQLREDLLTQKRLEAGRLVLDGGSTSIINFLPTPPPPIPPSLKPFWTASYSQIALDAVREGTGPSYTPAQTSSPQILTKSPSPRTTPTSTSVG